MKTSFTPAAAPPAPAAPRRRSRAQVVTYAEAMAGDNDELKVEMQKMLEPIDRLPDSLAAVSAFGQEHLVRFESWTHDVEKFFGRIPQQGPLPRERLREVEKMGLARVDITREISLWLGIVPEALRRYNEEYIPQATVTANASGDPKDEVVLHDILRRKEDLIARTTLLEATRVTSITTSQLLRQVIDAPDVELAHELFAKQVQPCLQSWRRHRAGGIYPQMLDVTSQLELPRDIKIRKPLTFRPQKA